MSAETLRRCECGCGAAVAGRFVKGHNAKFWTQRPAVDRFWEKVDKSGDCWVWAAGITRQGYGRFSPEHSTTLGAHRYAYSLAYGPIPDGLVIDHRCGNKGCVRVDHLEAVTVTENIRRAHRATVTNRCKRDHEFTTENTRVRRDGSRSCRACERIRREASYVK